MDNLQSSEQLNRNFSLRCLVPLIVFGFGRATVISTVLYGDLSSISFITKA